MTILACDMGGTRIKLGLVRDGCVVADDVIPAHSDKGLAPRLPALAEAFAKLAKANGVEPRQYDGISVSFPSIMDHATGRILAEYGKYRDAMDVDMRAWAKKEFGLPLAIENDARTAMIGEWRHGAGRGCDNLVMVTLGTGLGTAAIIEGKVLRGKHGQAGINGGHLTVRYGGRPCNCRNIGCAEAEASQIFLKQLAAERADFATSALASAPVLDMGTVFRTAAKGDACAIAIREHTLLVWSTMVVNLIHAYDPELVIIGGGIMHHAAYILPAMNDYVARHAISPWGKVKIVASELGDHAALIAGEWLVEELLKEKR